MKEIITNEIIPAYVYIFNHVCLIKLHISWLLCKAKSLI